MTSTDKKRIDAYKQRAAEIGRRFDATVCTGPLMESEDGAVVTMLLWVPRKDIVGRIYNSKRDVLRRIKALRIKAGLE